MTADERASLKALYPAHYFCKVIALGHQCIIAIPHVEPDPVLPGGLNLSLLHGATVRIGDTGPVNA